ncbi:chalcone isomerase family protein [Geomonas sp.]|uniref:chalcone isomerase family protein n=1 Tax=Geomonas sp. TaxID=2651584 RepID=UPI002B46A886|nr:chalcone isomerase family protein [Geomonas sp.]HJV34984.1 chalcone isomerase family protein [Geomonas sp.]
MRLLPALLVVLVLGGTASALEVAGVQVQPAVTVDNHVLKLNGSGVRRKFMVKVYVGSLYATRPVRTPAEALSDKGDKLIRMNFLYSKVEREKIVEAFQEGFRNNSPQVADTPEARSFLALFTGDFRRGDLVDLTLGGDGTVTVKHNGRLLGTVHSPRLAVAILAIYLGDKPADEGLKKGMLGGE